MILGLEDGIQVVGSAGSGEETVRLAGELLPDVVLMDVRMPRLSGIEAARRVKEEVPSTRILMLTSSEEDADLFAAIKAGASGYLLKSVDPEDIAAGIRAVAAGQSLVPPSLASRLLEEFAALSRRHEVAPPGPDLTARELQVLKQIALGRKNRDIAEALFISENTVKNHVRNILEKLQLHSRVEVALYAMREHLIEQ